MKNKTLLSELSRLLLFMNNSQKDYPDIIKLIKAQNIKGG